MSSSHVARISAAIFSEDLVWVDLLIPLGSAALDNPIVFVIQNFWTLGSRIIAA